MRVRWAFPPFHLLEALQLRARAVACGGCEVPGMRAQFWCQAETLVTGRKRLDAAGQQVGLDACRRRVHTPGGGIGDQAALGCVR